MCCEVSLLELMYEGNMEKPQEPHSRKPLEKGFSYIT
jgi:hypothetical protein